MDRKEIEIKRALKNLKEDVDFDIHQGVEGRDLRTIIGDIEKILTYLVEEKLS